MLEDTYGHTPYHKAFERADVYGVGYDEERAARRPIRLGVCGAVTQSKVLPAVARLRTIWGTVQITAMARRSQMLVVSPIDSACHGCLKFP